MTGDSTIQSRGLDRVEHSLRRRFLIILYREQESRVLELAEGKEIVVGVGQYIIDEPTHTAEAAFVVRDEYQNRGIGRELLSYLTYLAKRSGLHGFTAAVLMDNLPMLHVFEGMGFVIEKHAEHGMYELTMSFRS